MASKAVNKNLTPRSQFSHLLYRYGLLWVVFLTGACVLVIEVAAPRILSPYFGNTIFSYSSVLSVVLAALSLGYYVGGRLADRYPSERFFFGIIAVSGLSVLLLQSITQLLLPMFGYTLPITVGPLITSTLLFALPGFLIGMLSPFAVKLQSARLPDIGTGTIAGETFFWSTLGSIVGSLATGFLFIPHLGISQIVITVGVVLFLLGVLPILIMGVKKKYLVPLIIGTSFLLLVNISLVSTNLSDVYAKDGIYEKITIVDDQINGRPVRYLIQDRSSSGAIYLDGSDHVFNYSKYYSLYQLFNPNVKNALIIGGGAYTMPNALLKELPNATIEVSEIEPSLLSLSQQYFGISQTDRLINSSDDGRRYLHNSTKQYELIFSDVYFSLFSIPAHFTTVEFFQTAKNKLAPDGIFIANIIGNLSRQTPSMLFSEMKTFQEVFPNSYFFAAQSAKSLDTQNVIFVGYNSDKQIEFTDQSKTSELQEVKSQILDTDRFELTPYLRLVDDYTPVDILSAQMIHQRYDVEPKRLYGEEMMALIDQQLRYGPRYVGAAGHTNVQKFLEAELQALSPQLTVQSWTHTASDSSQLQLKNFVARFNTENQNRVIVATHYDSRRYADNDQTNPTQPVPGANDSASGTAMVLELARYLGTAANIPAIGIDLVFFDAEEGEGTSAPWSPLGSQYFATNLQSLYTQKPQQAVVVDMICDHDLVIGQELNSVKNTPNQVQKFWEIGNRYQPVSFDSTVKYSVYDDHTMLQSVGIPSFLVIDFDYPYFHTIHDTVDKCSPDSLEVVGNTVLDYLYQF